MLQGEHSAILSTFIKLPFVLYIFFLPIFEWPPKTGFTIIDKQFTRAVPLTAKVLNNVGLDEPKSLGTNDLSVPKLNAPYL